MSGSSSVCEENHAHYQRSTKGDAWGRVALRERENQGHPSCRETRPPVESDKVLLGERGPLTEKGVRALYDKIFGNLRNQVAP